MHFVPVATQITPVLKSELEICTIPASTFLFLYSCSLFVKELNCSFTKLKKYEKFKLSYSISYSYRAIKSAFSCSKLLMRCFSDLSKFNNLFNAEAAAAFLANFLLEPEKKNNKT